MEVPRATPRSSEPVKPRLSPAGLTALRSPDAGRLSPPALGFSSSVCHKTKGLQSLSLFLCSGFTPKDPSHVFHHSFSILVSFNISCLCVLRTQAAKPANGEMEGAGSDISDWGRVLSLTPQSHAAPPLPPSRSRENQVVSTREQMPLLVTGIPGLFPKQMLPCACLELPQTGSKTALPLLNNYHQAGLHL